jgi:hypothetical protein
MSTTTQNNRIKQQATTTVDAGGYGNGATVAGPCTLLRLLCTNKSAGTLWIALFNGAAASGTPAIAPIAIGAGTTVSLDLSTVSGEGWSGIGFSSGLTWAASSSATFNQDATSSLWPTLTLLQ